MHSRSILLFNIVGANINTITYISVILDKSKGLFSINTNEGLDERIYQLYREEDIEKLLTDNESDIADSEKFLIEI